MELNFVELGGEPGEAGAPLVVLHGLLGSLRNWGGAGRDLAKKRKVYLLDLRNHGDSPWSERHDYGVMREDVLTWMDFMGLDAVDLLGHSMGGKVAMQLACCCGERVRHLVVADIAPRAYAPRWRRAFAAMNALPVAELKSRQEADEWMGREIGDEMFRRFLLTNLGRTADGFGWKVNLAVLTRELPQLFANSLGEGDHYGGPVLVVRGGDSPFVSDEDLKLFERYFSHLEVETVTGSGHNVHVEARGRFVARVEAFLES